MGEILAAGELAGLALKNLCVWTKPSGGMGSFYRSKHELIFVFKVGTAAHINDFGLGGRGRAKATSGRTPRSVEQGPASTIRTAGTRRSNQSR